MQATRCASLVVEIVPERTPGCPRGWAGYQGQEDLGAGVRIQGVGSRGLVGEGTTVLPRLTWTKSMGMRRMPIQE